MEKLREEILQAQRARSDLLKWKLGLVGVIGSIGLGLAGSSSSKDSALVLCVLPLVCAYVDLLCRHLSLRMIVIGTFLRSDEGGIGSEEGAVFVRYEGFVGEVRDGPDPFALENWAVDYSTRVVSLFVLAYGVVILAKGSALAAVFFVSGLVGVAATWWAGREFRRRQRALAEAV
jgi:hypothetical protein